MLFFGFLIFFLLLLIIIIIIIIFLRLWLLFLEIKRRSPLTCSASGGFLFEKTQFYLGLLKKTQFLWAGFEMNVIKISFFPDLSPKFLPFFFGTPNPLRVLGSFTIDLGEYLEKKIDFWGSGGAGWGYFWGNGQKNRKKPQKNNSKSPKIAPKSSLFALIFPFSELILTDPFPRAFILFIYYFYYFFLRFSLLPPMSGTPSLAPNNAGHQSEHKIN